MPRPSYDQPTPGELEVLKILWDNGASTGRDVMRRLNEDGRERAYTSVTSLLNVMVDKQWLARTPQGRAFIYSAVIPRRRALRGLVSDLIGRAFEGSASQLVAHLLDESKLTSAELEKIREAIEKHSQQQ